MIAAELFSAKNKQPEGWDFGSLLRFQLAGTLLVCVLLAATLSAWGSFTLSISCDSPLVTLVLKLSDDFDRAIPVPRIARSKSDAANGKFSCIRREEVTATENPSEDC